MPFQIIRQDITKMDVDAIVNAANTQLKQGGGVCGAIFEGAGARRMQEACDAIGGVETGQAAITPGFDLPARWVIHTAGPKWQGGHNNEEELLRASYLNSLVLAHEKQLESIAFPLISSGIYGYPKDRALQTALAAISDFLMDHEMQVYLAVFDKTAFQLSGTLFRSVTAYIDDHYARRYRRSRREWLRDSREMDELQADLPYSVESVDPSFEYYAPTAPQPLSTDPLQHIEPEASFKQRLFELIDQRGLTDAQVYKRANLDRKLFSKIRTTEPYSPTKNTALSFAIALRLSEAETEDLLRRAGHALSDSIRFDLIVRYFIHNRHYDIFDINAALFEFESKTL